MIDFRNIKTIPLKNRKNLVDISDFADPKKDRIEIINTPDFNDLCERIKTAHKNNKQIILMMGAHLIKVGMSPYIIELMKNKVITHVAINGAGSIHDFEIALIGATSEDVATNIEDGTFGMSEETGKMMNETIIEAAKKDLGMGYCLGKKIIDSKLKYAEYSILANAYKLKIPCTIHVAIGTDIIHQHPSCDGAAIGKTSYKDFKILTDSLTKIENGVILNIGSAVIMPEVFLKSITIVRNLGYPANRITTAVLDMNKHYRPQENIVKRPTAFGGKGYYIQERHEKTIPSIYKKILG